MTTKTKNILTALALCTISGGIYIYAVLMVTGQ